MEAVPEPTGRKDGEGQEHGDDNAAQDRERPRSPPTTEICPDECQSRHDEHQRVELRGHGEPEEPEAEQLAPPQDRRQRADGQGGGEEVVGVEGDRADRDRRQREERGRRIQPATPHPEGHENQHDGEERRDPAERHQALEGEVVGPGREHGRRQKDRERAGRVLDEDVPVRKLAAQEPVRVDPVQVDVPVSLRPEEASVGNGAREQEDGCCERGDARGESHLRLRRWRRRLGRGGRRDRRRLRAAGGGGGTGRGSEGGGGGAGCSLCVVVVAAGGGL